MVLHQQNLYHLELMPTHLVNDKNHHQVKVQFYGQLSFVVIISVVLNSTSSNDDSLVEDLSNVYTDSVTEEEPIKQSSSAKRKSDENQVPRLIENRPKRKHIEKTLSAA